MEVGGGRKVEVVVEVISPTRLGVDETELTLLPTILLASRA